PVTDLPTSLAEGLICRVIWPDSPGPNTSGWTAPVPVVNAAQASPVSDDIVVSNFLMVATAVIVTGCVSAPAELNGPMSAGTTFHRPHGITGSARDATTVLGPARLAKISGLPVVPTRNPELLNASMLIGTVDFAVN